MRVVLAAVLVAGVFVASSGVPSEETSPTYAYATFKEESGRVTVLVDSLSASFHDADRFVPIPVAIGVTGYDGAITVSPETFTLLDQAGRPYPAASHREVAEEYPKYFFDQRLTRSRPVTAQQFVMNRRIPSRFYTSGAERRIPRVHLDAYTWFRDVIYFPRPDSGLGGVLTLRLSGGGIDPPIEVRFRIPLPGIPIR